MKRATGYVEVGDADNALRCRQNGGSILTESGSGSNATRPALSVHAVVTARTMDARVLGEAMYAIPAEWFRPSPLVYWCDLVASAGIGWAAFGAAVESTPLARAALLAIAAAALYRAVLFIHEITHRAAREVPMFKLAWNVLVGIPLLIPSFLYEGVHTDHHRQRCYGTDADPEYVPYGRRQPRLIAWFVLVSILAPLIFATRFALLAPLSWIVPPLRRMTRERASALVVNPRYIRRTPFTAEGRLQEAAACAFVWTIVWLWQSGRVTAALIQCWLFVTAAVALVNAVRTLAAHRYDNDADEVSMLQQLLDSCTIADDRHTGSAITDIGRAILAPVGLRFHALHHWIPSLPYHNLGRTHRRLIEVISPDAPYRATIARSPVALIRDLVHRSRSRS
jgi:fatty acid desaturase